MAHEICFDYCSDSARNHGNLVKERHLAQATQVDIVDVRKPIAASFINDRQVYEYLLHPPP
jgi:hypothetical protein